MGVSLTIPLRGFASLREDRFVRLLAENQGYELCEILSPHGPAVIARGLEIGVADVLCLECGGEILVDQRVILAAREPQQFQL